MSARRELAISPAFHPWICEEVMISKLTHRLIDALLTQSRSPMWRSLDPWPSHRQTRTCPSSLDLYWRCICTKWSRSRNPCNQCCSQNMFPPTIIPSTGEISHIYSTLTTKNAWFMVIPSSGLAGFHEMPVPDHYAWVHPCHSGDSWLWYCIHRSQCSCHLVSTCSPGWRFYVGHGGNWGESWHSVTRAHPIRVLCTVNVSLCTSLV